MTLAAIHDLQIDAREAQFGRHALLVVPHQRRVVNFDVGLREQPVAEAATVGRRRVGLDPGDPQHAAAVAPHVEHRPVDVEGVEAHAQHGERLPRQRAVDARQFERGAVRLVVDDDVLEHEARSQTVPVPGDMAD